VNRAGQEIYRFQAYMKPSGFLKELAEATRRWTLFKSGKPWDDPNPRPAQICDEGIIETFRAPGSAFPAAWRSSTAI